MTNEPVDAQPINADHMKSDPLAYPIYCMEPGVTVPADQTCYILAGNGLWLQKTNGIMRGIIPVDGISHLDSLTPTIGMDIENIPVYILLRALIFFRRVYIKYHAESELQLFYKRTDGKFDLFCPDQTVSYGGVDYKPDQWEDPNHNLQEHLLVGTIHSHCNFGASHSSTDLRDERYAEGIHVTVGHVDSKEFSLVCSMQMGKQRMQIDPTMKINGLERASSRTVYFQETTQFYRLKLPMKKAQLKAIVIQMEREIEEIWLPKVRQKSFFQGYQSYNSYSRKSDNEYNHRDRGDYSRDYSSVHHSDLGESPPTNAKPPTEITQTQDVVAEVKFEQREEAATVVTQHEKPPPAQEGTV